MVLTSVGRRRHALDLFQDVPLGTHRAIAGPSSTTLTMGYAWFSSSASVPSAIRSRTCSESGGEVGIFDEHAGLEVRGQGAVGEVGRADERARRASSAKCWP